MKQKRLIYILGAGRSGTTILDIVLGNCSGAISLGEINRFFKRDGIAPIRKEGSKVDTLWKGIKTTFDKKSSEDYAKLNKVFNKNEYHTNFARIYLFGADDFYQETLVKQYQSIVEHTNDKKVLIESSKYPARALNISSTLSDDFDIGYIYQKKTY
ncbi:hypothetical protein [Allomuricauda sp. CP2A]|uniref:hypothetical protein n=1 Tax=Allomuricauda sp. CP2A TaxID=1848189 RepID=UPI00082E8915|nr:hypothetical protein [Muricauda sp. CP2A]